MIEEIQRLQYLCDIIPAKLRSIDETIFAQKPQPAKWSKKEILGHLIDSATNNHHRIVRVQFEDSPQIVYDQDKWNASSRYNQMPTEHLIIFWETYNRHLIELIKAAPESSMAKRCDINKEDPVTLQWLIADYVRHLEHHLRQIMDYD